ncbi:polysaccharide biosynthesis tyrosine autokinase [Sinimarinibacterium sp. NLF-5-8]|uniref:polysaccharide biosynthesis tyrosine autokinase n=1 Tax=Sinimarinibacterium sp. NLF-5-8 TaxID=2698684 RepID=UPI00137C0318|nr:polysaccharide biosynthesis tyrosine autokinase [Sinimarinibacterium sp. NLF-5-8]QHS09373.1 polysaccharide biosynthesis tyrosine autokinase [Sinimarinibacterium sp. NLF-5-8]
MNRQNSTAPAVVADDDEIDLRELWGVLVEARWVVIAIAAACLFLGTFYAWSATRIFDADALVQVEKKESGLSAAALGDLAGAMGTPSQATAEIELLKSRWLVGSVVDGLNANIIAEPIYFPLIGRALARGFVPDSEDRPVADPRFGLRGYAWGGEFIRVTAFDVPPTLLGKPFELQITDDGYVLLQQGEKILSGTVGQRAMASLGYRQEITLFVQDLVAAPGTRFSLMRIDRADAIAAIQQKLSISEQGRDSGMLRVSFSSDSPVVSREVINRLVMAYQRQNVERRSAEAAQTLTYLERQLPEIRQKLETAEVAYNSFRLSEGSADLSKETELVLQQSVQMESERVRLEQQRRAALERFTPDHPTIVAIDRQLQGLLDEQRKISGRVKNLPEVQQEVLRLARDVQVNTAIYTNLLNNYQELQVAKGGQIGNVRIVDYALSPLKASKPKVPLIMALSLVLGGMLGVGVVLIRRAMRVVVNDPAVVEQMLGVPTYATVPYTSTQRRLTKQKDALQDLILARADPQDLAIEALRSLRTSLHFALMEAKNNIIMLTGPSPGLGKSFVSINLAAVLAASGKRVVVIDADMRRGHLHDYLKCDRGQGLSDYCVGQAALDDILLQTTQEQLTLISTGTIPPNPAELLMSQRFADLLNHLSTQFDYVLIDTPPILAVTDAAIIGRQAGCTLLLIKAGEHSASMLQDSAARLRNGGVDLRGTIFNQVGRKGTGYAAHHYGYTYDYRSHAKT